jgi:Amt family ammonium transporter
MGIAQAGMIRRKNSLSMMMQCVSGMAIGSLLWYVVGYSLTFGPDVGGIIGDPIPFFFFNDMPRSNTECLSVAPSIPGPLFAAFQMMFALMVPVIVTGAWAEKLKMEAFVIFMVLWPLLVYYPVAHWIWGGGWMAELGAIDFAGGITIHTNAGIAAMVVSLMLSPRRNVEKLEMSHHNISLLVHTIPYVLYTYSHNVFLLKRKLTSFVLLF